MIANLGRYLDRLYATIHSRQGTTVEAFELYDRSVTAGRTSEFYVRLRFWDGSLLQVEEALVAHAYAIVKTRYSYHYQDAEGDLVFRYDNAPHYLDLPGFPEHRHDPNGVAPAAAPDLGQVLREIDEHLAPPQGDEPSRLT